MPSLQYGSTSRDLDGVESGQYTDASGTRRNYVANLATDGTLRLDPETEEHHYHVYDDTGREHEPMSVHPGALASYKLPPGQYCLTSGADTPRQLILFEVNRGTEPGRGGEIQNWDEPEVIELVPKIWHQHWPQEPPDPREPHERPLAAHHPV